MEKETQTWEPVTRKIFRNKALTPKIKILLWGSLIRSALIYGPHTMDLSRYLLNKMAAYMYKHHRIMTNQRCKLAGWNPERKQLCQTLHQLTTGYWLSKTKFMKFPTQTQDNKTIRPLERKGMPTPRGKPREQWNRNTNASLEQKTAEGNNAKNQHAYKYSKNSENGDIQNA